MESAAAAEATAEFYVTTPTLVCTLLCVAADRHRGHILPIARRQITPICVMLTIANNGGHEIRAQTTKGPHDTRQRC